MAWPRSTECSSGCEEPVVLLLNNDVKLDPGAVGPLLRVFETKPTHSSRRLAAGRLTAAPTKGCGPAFGAGLDWFKE